MAESFDFDPSLPDAAKKILDMYRRAVFVEMYHLKNEGGRQYKVTNGQRIGRTAGGYAYSFDIEEELFLSEDAPITITVGTSKNDGVVLSSEDFKITVIMEDDLGERVNSAMLRAEPWKLLQSLNDRLAMMSARHNLALKLMLHGRVQTGGRPIDQVPIGQEEAMGHVLENPITVIWGPPGTGKTHTMAEIAIRYLLSGKKVLVVAHSNISVDGVVGKVAELMRSRGLESRLERGKVMRFGHVRDEQLTNDPQVVAYNYALRSNKRRAQELKELNDRLTSLKKTHRGETQEAIQLQSKIKEIRRGVREDEKYFVDRADLVATTVSKLYANKLFEDKTYDLVMFDEISMAYVPQVICAAMSAAERLVLVGDFRQLAPITKSEKAKEALSHDIFWFLNICDQNQNAHYHPWLVMLNEQRRMHPSISAFPSNKFYGKLLKDHETVLHGRDAIALAEPCKGSPMTLVDLRGTYCASARNSDHSRYNILSALLAFGFAMTAEKSGEDSVGIISPYVAQVRLIKALLKDYQAHGRKTEIACSTVHQFQGSERNVVVLDTVESFPSSGPGILTNGNENGSVNRLVNVAVTRARGKLITLANKDLWDLPKVKKNNAFQLLVNHHLAYDRVLRTRDQSLYNELVFLDFGPNIEMLTLRKANERLASDIAGAKQRIVISIPDGKLLEPYDSDFCSSLRAAKKRGIELLMKCTNPQELPSVLRGQVWESEDAVFPLLLIDNKVCWYGMPLSVGRVRLANGMSVQTAMQTPFRITGENAINMIGSVTELETREADGIRVSLKQRGNASQNTASATATDGLAQFIKEHRVCKKCKAPMRMVRGRKSFFLACTNKRCDATELLDPGYVDHYICVSRVRCPKCGSGLHAAVNNYGIHLRCEKGCYVNVNQV